MVLVPPWNPSWLLALQEGFKLHSFVIAALLGPCCEIAVPHLQVSKGQVEIKALGGLGAAMFTWALGNLAVHHSAALDLL